MNNQYNNPDFGNISSENRRELPTLNDTYNSNPFKREIHDVRTEGVEYPADNDRPDGKSRIIMIAVGAAVALLIIVGACFFFLYNPENNTGATTAGQAVTESMAGSEDDIEFSDDSEEGAAAESPTPYDYTAMVCYHRLTPADLRGCPKAELEMMLATIYARRGYAFPDDEEMSTFFSRFSWYSPVDDQLPTELSDIEAANIAMLREALK